MDVKNTPKTRPTTELRSPAVKKTQTENISQVRRTEKVSPVTDFSSSKLEFVDPTKHGPIAQLINDNYRAQVGKTTRRLLTGKLLKQILERDYTAREFQRLPRSVKNLIRFDRNMNTAEITKFTEFVSAEHQINFKDYKYDLSKFRAVFNAQGELIDVEMMTGFNNFVALSNNFELKRTITDLFAKFKQRMILRKRQQERLRARKREAQSA